ncbi:putative chitinase 3 [Portunus trituberculatus]|uniref:chitinase n=1 Tax=Portunus trituberculatus TaxID=210409 RepID=A0A5B7CFZ7_PORTR|nr:putative chitinase 3 [Portunus trituberculatus]
MEVSRGMLSPLPRNRFRAKLSRTMTQDVISLAQDKSFKVCAILTYLSSMPGVCTEEGQKFCLPGESLRINTETLNPQPLTKMAGELKVVCYFTNWAYYRPDPYKFSPENVDPSLCTHIIYAYASLDTTDLFIRSLDPYLDFEYEFYKRLLNLRNQAPGLKVMLGLGGWVDSSSDKYSRLVNNPKARAKFVQHTTEVLTVYGFDGLDFGWMFPRCWKMKCTSGPQSDVQGFTDLMKELKASFQPRGLILSAAVSSFKKIIDMSYDVPALSSAVDFLNVMTYDFHGAWERMTGHVSPLMARPEDKFASQNSDYAMNYWVGKGADPGKLVMGIPFYGQTFTLADSRNNGLNAQVTNGGDPGPATLQRGMMAYFEICQAVRTRGWTKVVDTTKAIGPYAHNGNQWYSYEDQFSVTHKAQYIKNKGYGGAMVWDLSLDDVLNRCCLESMPLLRAINRQLRSVRYPEPRPGGGDCTGPQQAATPFPPRRTTTYASALGTKVTESHYGEFNLSKSTTTSLQPWMTTWSATTRRTTTEPIAHHPVPEWPPHPHTEQPPTTQQSTTIWWQTTPITTTTTTTTRRPTTTWRPVSVTSAIEEMQPSGTGPHPGDSCQGNQNFPSPGKCTAYLSCVNGKLVEKLCVSGLHWNNAAGICDWKWSAKCKQGQAPGTPPSGPGGKPSYPPSGPPSGPVRPPSVSRPSVRPTQTPFPTRSTTEEQEAPTTTTTRRTTTQSTTPTWWWTPPPSTPRTTTKSWWVPSAKPTTTTTTTTTTTFTTSRPAVIDVVDVPAAPPSGPCNEGQSTGVPGDCTKFKQCLHGVLQVLECPGGLHWNERKKMCDWPHNAKCSGSAVRGAALLPFDSTPTQQKEKCYSLRHLRFWIFLLSLVHVPPSNFLYISLFFLFPLCSPGTPRQCYGPTGPVTRNPDGIHNRNKGRTPCSKEGQTYPGPQCTARVRCSQGYFTVELCTGGLVWNERDKACTLPSSVPKCSDVILTPKDEGRHPPYPASLCP